MSALEGGARKPGLLAWAGVILAQKIRKIHLEAMWLVALTLVKICVWLLGCVPRKIAVREWACQGVVQIATGSAWHAWRITNEIVACRANEDSQRHIARISGECMQRRTGVEDFSIV
jgi:hypothetical protein